MEISVIIPTYKPGQYLWQCLDSLRAQTFDGKRFEVVIVLNGCEEPYLTQINEYIKEQCIGWNFSLIQTNHAGVSNARNIGLDASKGRLICFIDDDDWISPDYLTSLYDLTDGRDDVLPLSNVTDYNQKTGKLEPNFLTKSFQRNQDNPSPSLLSARSFFSTVCAKLIPREIISEHRFSLRFKRLEDALFMAYISDKVKEIRFAQPSATYYYRIRGESASNMRLPLGSFLKENLLQASTFINIYLQHPLKYNLPFFATRLLAIARTVFKRVVFNHVGNRKTSA